MILIHIASIVKPLFLAAELADKLGGLNKSRSLVSFIMISDLYSRACDYMGILRLQ